ncbi:hypothetical protein ES703_53627 [subsurface metagenome]
MKYIRIHHSTAYTAQEIAASAHIKGENLAKTVIVKIDGKMAMAVLPAKFKIDLARLKETTGSSVVELAAENEFVKVFPECEAGAMPPFGNLYDMKVYVDKTLTDAEEISFNAGSHSELIQLNYKDFENLVRPEIAYFSA